jgi:S1-C subfamily serine protease
VRGSESREAELDLSDWKVPRDVQPKAEHYGYDLDRALSAVLALSAIIPFDAYTADALGTERAGSAVVIRESGLAVTIGYLVTEAESVWLSLGDGRVVPGDVLAIDQESGLALVQPLSRLNIPPLTIGESAQAKVGDKVILAGGGGRQRSVAARIVGKQEFAGYWEYLLEEAIFTAPAHPNWGGTALIDEHGRLLGIGSLQLQQDGDKRAQNANMVVPIDLLTAVLDDLLARGATDRPPRPWLGFYATEIDRSVAVADVASRGPAESAGVQPGDVILAVGDSEAHDLAGLFRLIWAQGPAGTAIPLRVLRKGRMMDISVVSTDRRRLFRKPRLH